MDDSAKVVSDQPKPQGSAQGEEIEQSSTKDSVKYETYRQVLSEKKKRDEQLSELNQKLQSLEQANKEREEKELREKENWKALLEKRELELKDINDRYHNVLQQQVIGTKASAFMNQIGGLKNDRYLEFVPFDEIGYDEETGKVDEVSLRNVIDKFRKEHEALIASKPAAPLPASAPRGAASDQVSERKAMLERISKVF